MKPKSMLDRVPETTMLKVWEQQTRPDQLPINEVLQQTNQARQAFPFTAMTSPSLTG